MRAPVLATGRAFSSQRARAVSEKRKAAHARALIHQNRRAHSVRIQNSDHACMNSEFCMHARCWLALRGLQEQVEKNSRKKETAETGPLAAGQPASACMQNSEFMHA